MLLNHSYNPKSRERTYYDKDVKKLGPNTEVLLQKILNRLYIDLNGDMESGKTSRLRRFGRSVSFIDDD